MKMKAPEGVMDIHVDGVNYEPDENGIVDVPLAVAIQLEFHRFVHWIDPVVTDDAKAKKPKE